MSVVIPKGCAHPACKCQVQEGECCGDFCKDTESSEDDLRCGCGHMACDTTKELGNENSFASTGS